MNVPPAVSCALSLIRKRFLRKISLGGCFARRDELDWSIGPVAPRGRPRKTPLYLYLSYMCARVLIVRISCTEHISEAMHSSSSSPKCFCNEKYLAQATSKLQSIRFTYILNPEWTSSSQFQHTSHLYPLLSNLTKNLLIEQYDWIIYLYS